MKNSKILSILFFFILSCSIFAQNQQIKKADKLYKLSQYAEAIELYEAGMKDSESLSAKTKLAYCYRMTNKMGAAERIYSEIVQNERAKTITHFYYAESLMANQKYDEAKSWFLKYAELNPNDERGTQMANACDEVRLLRPLYKKVEITPFSQNSEVDDSAPVYFNDGIVFSSDRKSGMNPLKQKSGWTGRDYLQIYFSRKTVDGNFEKPGSFSKKMNELNKHCGPVSFNADLSRTVFTRTGTHPGRGNTYNMQLYSAESSDGSKWKKVKELPFCKKEHNYMHPALSPDGKLLFFVSDKPGGEGGTDIYKSEWTSKGWSRPLNLGIMVNTIANEGFPFVSADGKLYFCSKGHTGYGGFDIYVTERDEKGLWSKPLNLGMPINSSYDDISFYLNENGLEGMLSSNRDGGDDDIFFFDILEKADEADWIVSEDQPDHNSPEESFKAETIIENGKITNQLKSEIRVEEEAEKLRLPEKDVQKTETVVAVPEIENPGFEEPIELEIPTASVSKVELKRVSEPESEESEDFEDPMEIVERQESLAKENLETEPVSTQAELTLLETIRAEEKPDGVDATLDFNNEEESIVEEIDTEDPPKEEGTVSGVNDTSEILDAKIKYDVKTPYKGTTVQIIPDDIFTSKGGSKTEILDERKPDLNPATKKKPANSPYAPEMMYDRPAPKVYPLVQMKFLLKKNIPVKGKSFRINGLEFAKGQYIVSPDATLQLNRLIDILNQYPDLKIEIATYTSSPGDDLENLELSRARAGAIMASLINHGIAQERLSSNGYGESRLLNHCANDVNCSVKEHKANQRVEVRIF